MRKFKSLLTILITFLILLVFMIVVLNIYSNRIEKIENGEMVLVNQNQMDR